MTVAFETWPHWTSRWTAHARPVQVALAWLIAHPSITAPIASATNLKQLNEPLGAARLTLDSIASRLKVESGGRQLLESISMGHTGRAQPVAQTLRPPTVAGQRIRKLVDLRYRRFSAPCRQPNVQRRMRAERIGQSFRMRHPAESHSMVVAGIYLPCAAGSDPAPGRSSSYQDRRPATVLRLQSGTPPGTKRAQQNGFH
jgi:hypothetical protein